MVRPFIMNKITLLALAIAASLNISHAQGGDKPVNASLNFALTMPQGGFKSYYKNGAHISFDINARLAKPLWVYGQGIYEAFATRDSVTTPNRIGLGSIGAAAGLKIVPFKFIYINAGAGLKLSTTPITDYLDNVSPYVNLGAGIWLSSTVGIFASYTTWKAAKDFPSNNYFLAGISFGFGRK